MARFILQIPLHTQAITDEQMQQELMKKEYTLMLLKANSEYKKEVGRQVI